MFEFSQQDEMQLLDDLAMMDQDTNGLIGSKLFSFRDYRRLCLLASHSEVIATDPILSFIQRRGNPTLHISE